ncbi:MerR family transcriptional regulator [Enterococcus gilvus]|uniref:HTH merR-type domain-containing protein n=1 Tax=Enterococcus gilvus ATCC BAA-350 TaxID=1158614 RepID=R2XZI4_9ENTE|nr:MerR family transcriptional regulator [Enterococcus gilvus]EOI55452.1 hypothetical protein UKC_02660 [Enterococcus gilvus ATCC BAA-350]EOW82005.1 hypothetical protein I592_01306 [Enterococcus gilvus ATCC BAA-350]OJG43034.1 hypothetical protein RV02_GL002954 [Enterococcus gilvus]
MEYGIGEFSKITDLSIDTIRFYEREGLIIPRRDANNRRVFEECDIGWIDFIKKLKMTGMKLKDIKYYAELRYQGDRTIDKRLELLYRQADILFMKQKEVSEHIKYLYNKIDIYNNKLEEQHKNRDSDQHLESA